MADDLVLTVHEQLTAYYVVVCDDVPHDLPALLSDQVRLMAPSDLTDPLVSLLASPLADIEVLDGRDAPPVAWELLAAFGADAETVERARSGRHHVVCSCVGLPGRPPFHEWAALAAAQAVAALTGGVLLDVVVPRVLPRPEAGADPDDGRLGPARRMRIADWVLVPQSVDEEGAWLSTTGLVRFGLPELSVHRVPPYLVAPWTSLLTGLALRLVAQQAEELGDDSAPQPGLRAVPREWQVGVADVARAYGDPAWLRERPPAGSDEPGHATVALEHTVLDAQGGDPMLEVVPPPGVTSSAGAWAADVVAAVLGRTGTRVRKPVDQRAYDEAVALARTELPEVRERFLAGQVPLGASLIVKHRRALEHGAEYAWGVVLRWDAPDRLRVSSMADGVRDAALRAGHPLDVAEADVVDWAVWRDGHGTVEGHRTAEALGEGT